MAGNLAAVLSPVDIGPRTAHNRVVVTGHGAFLDFYKPGEDPDRYVGYLERRAMGGVGTIIMQPMHVHPSSHALGHHTYDRADMQRKFALVSDSLHRHGTVALVQLFHFGAQFTSDARRNLEPLWAFSPITSPEGETAHEMSDAEVEEIVQSFADAAVLAVESGMDGVELHAAHGYLLQQSFSPWANRRTDRWGEPLAFATAVLDRVRASVGTDAVVGLRISADDFLAPDRGGLGPEGLQDVAATLVRTGKLDYLNHSAGSRSAHYAKAIGSYRYEHAHMNPLTRGLRDAIDAAVPVIAVGRMTSLQEGDDAIRAGSCDMVAMTRAHIADPDVVAKARAGQVLGTRPCVGANQGCVDRMTSGLPITCFHNPSVGRERGVELIPATTPQTVLVAGGGPAGLIAAETAAKLGHRVVLAETGPHLGGRLRYVLELGRASELYQSVAWLERQLDALGVEIRRGTRVDSALLAELAPDTLVVATGAVADDRPLVPTDGSVPVLSTTAALDVRAERSFAGQRVMVVDHVGTQEVALTVERFTADGAHVTWVTPALSPGWAVGFTLLKDLMQVVSEAGTIIETSTGLQAIRDGRAVLRHVYRRTTEELPVDLVIAGRGAVADPQGLVELAAARGTSAVLAGDAVAPRTAMHAFREGFDAARALLSGPSVEVTAGV